MQAEERNTGAINWGVYKSYSVAGRGGVMLPLLFTALVLIQGATVMSSYWYVFSLAIEMFNLTSPLFRLVYWQEKCEPCTRVLFKLLIGLFAGNGDSHKVSMYVYFQLLEMRRLELYLQMGIYAMLGVSQAVAAFLMGSTFALFTYFASQRLHRVCVSMVVSRLDGANDYPSKLLNG